MSLTRSAEATASRTADSRWLELLARAGFIGYGIVHLLFAWLALQIAFGTSSDDGDQSGALRTLSAQPLGKFLVIAIAVGLLAMAIWQALEAAVGHRAERGKERVIERLASAGRTIVYLYFAWTAFKVFKDAGSNSADQQEALTGKLMTSSGGRWLVGLAGLVLAAIGIGLVIYGAGQAVREAPQDRRDEPEDPHSWPAGWAWPATSPRASRTASPVCWSSWRR